MLDHKISNEKGTNYPKNWQMTNINRMTRIWKRRMPLLCTTRANEIAIWRLFFGYTKGSKIDKEIVFYNELENVISKEFQ